jgi:hypothetical protein
MANVIDCLLKKASDGLVSKRTAQKIATLIDDYKVQIAGGDDVGKELAAAQRAFDVIENRLAQKVKQQEIHMNLLTQASERFKSKAPINVVLESFSYPSEANAYKYGYLGPSASETVLSNQRIFKGMASDIFEALSPKNVAKRGGASFEREVVEDLYAASRGIGKRSEDAAVRKISDDMLRLTTVGGESFERAGGNITLRKDYFLGRNPNTEKIIKAGKDNYVRDSVMAYDLERVSEATAGIIRTLEDLKRAVSKDYDSIVSGGISDLSEYAPPGMKSVVNSRNHHRIFSFKDAESDISWHQKYGNGNLYEKVNAYTSNIGRDIGLLQTYGPKPEAFIRSLLREAATIDPAKASKLKDVTYRHFRGVTGQWDKSLDPTVTRYLNNYRASQTASLLGSTVIDALTGDLTLGAIAKGLRGLPALRGQLRSLKTLFSKTYNKDMKLWASFGWYTDGFIDDAIGMLKQAEAEGADKFFDAAARLTMKYTGLTRVTNATKGENVRMLSELLSEVNSKTASPQLMTWLRNNGIDDKLLSLAQKYGKDTVEDWGVSVVNPVKLFEAGYEKEAAQLNTIFNKMSELVSPTTSARLRGYWSSLERGSKLSQIGVGSLRGFTGYPGSFWENHMKTVLSQPGLLNKAKWATAYALPLTMAGVVSTWIRDMLNGKDPKLDTETVARGMLRANVLLMLGDPLLGNSGMQSSFDRLVGPLGGNIDLLTKAGAHTLKGDWAKAAGKMQESLERLVPGRNAWFSNLILNRYVFDQIKHLYDEDAQKKFKQRTKSASSKGSPFWWEPGELSPERAPDIGNLLEQPFIRPEKRKTK